MSFFSQKKPKQFNHKAVYANKEDDTDTLSDKMYNQWNRASYADLLKAGNAKILFTIALALLLIYGSIVLYEYMIQLLN